MIYSPVGDSEDDAAGEATMRVVSGPHEIATDKMEGPDWAPETRSVLRARAS